MILKGKKHMKKTRILSLILTALLASQALVGCGDTESKNEDGTGGDTTVNTVVDPFEGWVLDDLPSDLRFDGEEFTIFCGYPVEGYFMEEETGDPVDDAIYARNQAVEERFGITLNTLECKYSSDGGSQGEATKYISSMILADDDTNDIYVHVQHTGMPGLIAQGLFQDWNEMKYFDFTKDYWYGRCLSDINYYDRVYAMTGSYNLGTLKEANCLHFNKRICEEVKLDYPYQLVKDGQWTADKFLEYIKSGATQDLNGDGKIDPNVDQTSYWGWGYEQVPAMFMAFGGDTVKKLADGSPELNINNERTFSVVDKMLEIFNTEGCAKEYSTYGIFVDAFESGKLLFLHSGVGSVHRNMDDDYGYLPYPKLDENQEGYCTRVQNTSCLTYIPITNNNTDMTSAVLEYMAMYSHNTVVEAFLDVNLAIKGVRDEESAEMIPIIRESCSFNDEAVSFSVSSCINDNKPLASYWASQEASVTKSLQENIIDVYSK